MQSEQKKWPVFAPAKLILSGEYSVMYNHPAIATPLPFGVSADGQLMQDDSITIAHWQPQAIEPEHVWVLARQQVVSTFRRIYADHQKRQEQGQQQKQSVFQHPYDLLLCAIYLASDGLQKLPNGFCLNYQSTIPIGSGLGSSAAISSAVIEAVLEVIGEGGDSDLVYRLACQNEDFAHGKSGLLDPWITTYKKSVVWHNGQAEVKTLKPLSFCLVDSGKPQTTTAEGVAQVRSTFTSDNMIWQRFAKLSQQIITLLSVPDGTPINQLDFYQAINQNHQLLNDLGVVPTVVNLFIQAVQEAGMSAKITGAGAIRGDTAGIVLVFYHQFSVIEKLAKQFSYRIIWSSNEYS